MSPAATVTVPLAAGCVAVLRWPEAHRVEIVVRHGREIRRRVRGAWTVAAIRQADAEVRQIVDTARHLRGVVLPPFALHPTPAPTAGN